MSLRPKFDLEKAIEVILYIANKASTTNKVNEVYWALKVLYFADKEHLSKYGRLICNDFYAAMSHGPVPSVCYDMIKYVRGDGFYRFNFPVEETFSADGNDIIPHRDANLDLLSESDIECLEESIEKYGHLPFYKLRDISHDDAFKSADLNDFISLENLAKSLPDGEQLLEYLANG